MAHELAALSVDLVSRQASVGVQDVGDGQYTSLALTFTFAEGHYSKRQLLEKAKRLLDEAAIFVKNEIARSP